MTDDARDQDATPEPADAGPSVPEAAEQAGAPTPPARQSHASSDGRDPLVIRELEFLGGMATVEGWRPDNLLPEVAFVGRSNVGKSSLLNRLVRRKAFARVSNTPGRTREINFFRVNGAFVFVDLPGYGYARIAKERRREWKPLMERYLRHTQQLRGIVMLLDARRDPSDDDVDMLDFLAEVEVPVLLAVTKIDKLKPREVAARIAALAGTLELDEEQRIPFSATTGEGRHELARSITELVDAPAWSAR